MNRIITYDVPDAQKYSKQKWNKKPRNELEEYSSSESDEEDFSGKQSWAWDKE